MTWWLVYLYNMRLPLLLVCSLGVMLCGIIGMWGSGQRNRSTPSSPLHTAAVERQMVSLKIGTGLAILAAIMWGIPAPDYDVRYVHTTNTVTVVKRVPVVKYTATRVVTKTILPRYQVIFDDCMSNMSYHTGDESKQCHDQAMVATTQQPQVVTRRFIQHDSYQTLFNNCNDNHDGGITSLPQQQSIGPRNDRIALCGRLALEGSRAH